MNMPMLSLRRLIALWICPELRAEIPDLVSQSRQVLGESFAIDATHSPHFKGGRRPSFWGDLPVREAVIALHRQATIDAAICTLEAKFGKERTPSRSAIGRVWKQLDKDRREAK